MDTVRYPRHDTAILGDLDDSFYFGVSCSSCHFSSRISLVRLRDELGWYFKLSKVRSKVRCAQCGDTRLIATFLTPAKNEARSEHLFRLRPQ
jgi:hypothetical protein